MPACVGTGCVMPACVGTGCVIPACVGTGCVIPACVGTGCVMPACVGTGCVMPACVGTGCVIPACVGTGCVMPACVGTGCVNLPEVVEALAGGPGPAVALLKKLLTHSRKSGHTHRKMLSMSTLTANTNTNVITRFSSHDRLQVDIVELRAHC